MHCNLGTLDTWKLGQLQNPNPDFCKWHADYAWAAGCAQSSQEKPPCLQGSEFQDFKVSSVQAFKVSIFWSVQVFKLSRFQGFKLSRFQVVTVSRLQVLSCQGFKCSSAQRYKVSRFQVFKCSRFQGVKVSSHHSSFAPHPLFLLHSLSPCLPIPILLHPRFQVSNCSRSQVVKRPIFQVFKASCLSFQDFKVSRFQGFEASRI